MGKERTAENPLKFKQEISAAIKECRESARTTTTGSFEDAVADAGLTTLSVRPARKLSAHCQRYIERLRTIFTRRTDDAVEFVHNEVDSVLSQCIVDGQSNLLLWACWTKRRDRLSSRVGINRLGKTESKISCSKTCQTFLSIKQKYTMSAQHSR